MKFKKEELSSSTKKNKPTTFNTIFKKKKYYQTKNDNKSNKKKYYAVKKGRIPGIYDDWESCKIQVSGFKGAVYKSFYTKEECQSFIDSSLIFKKKEQEKFEIKNKDRINIFTDGSCKNNQKKENKVSAIGYCVLEPNTLEIREKKGLKIIPKEMQNDVKLFLNENQIEKYEINIEKECENHTNQRSELFAIFKSIHYLFLNHENSNETTDADLYTDSSYSINIFKIWLNSWLKKDVSCIKEKKNKDLILSIRCLLDRLENEKKINIHFYHVKGHNGNYYNEIVDKLAQEAATDS